MYECILYLRPIRSSGSTDGRKGTFEEAEQVEQRMITEVAPKKLKLGEGE